MHTQPRLWIVLFASLIDCFSEFIRPPEYDEDQDADNDMRRNSPYAEGARISVLFDTNIREVDLRIFGDSDEDSSVWETQYDIANVTTSDEDTIYWFGLWDGKEGPRLARSQYVNVSAPEPDKSSSISATEISSFATQLSTTREAQSSVTESILATISQEPSEGTNRDSNSGLSGGEKAGAIVGGVIGGLSILVCVGWLFWKRHKRNKHDLKAQEELVEQHRSQQCLDTRVELPADDTTNPRHYATSPAGLHEAP
ncbi:hypothetical protein FLONG3_1993 [Fusarium longipes]|uniref:Mid2 domain-containing protein n=1 Tax=Fusarium longipes TaxID=694270 RepID=A0A395T6J3_9HYPO|nr:hypothetical protein FLONG3_1993 [Fusarium longipes]